jgi:hypothetical protein
MHAMDQQAITKTISVTMAARAALLSLVLLHEPAVAEQALVNVCTRPGSRA